VASFAVGAHGREEQEFEQEFKVTNYSQIASHAGRRAAATARYADGGFRASVLERVHQMLCGLHGHDSLLQFKRDRMFLKCSSCGHESPGWELTATPPTVRLRGDARRHVLARPPLPPMIDARRIA
jgi:hypothetical protein